MKSQNTKSSHELQKEVHKEIRNVRRDIDELQGRLSPGQIIDDAIFYPHGKSLASTFDHLKRNPVGTAFLSLGTILLMEDESQQTYESGAKSKLSSAKSGLSSKVQSIKENVKSHLPHKELTPGSAPSTGDILKSKINETKEGLQSKAGSLKASFQDKVSGLKEDTQAKVSELKEGMQEKQEGIKDTLDSKIEDAKIAFGGLDESETGVSEPGAGKIKNKAAELYGSGKEKIQNLDPMVYMALGAGLGALTGASLPVSEKEQKFVDEKMRDRFSSLNQDFQDALNESSNILKDLVINDFKDMNFKVFR